MPSEFYFMAFGGLGVSLAGFAGLIQALDRSPAAQSAVAAYRVRGIVFLGFCLTLVGFGTVALYTVTGENLTLTVRIATIALALMAVRGLLESRPGPAWRTEGERRVSIVVLTLIITVTLGNLLVADLGYLQLLLLLQLSGPMSIFYNTIRDATAVDPTDANKD
ncbi:MAG TPA: hypothetical protein VL749_01805 [Patescibacteria group bacterium]|nr:hypothetical protein [Patescibacteria group bacterium]